MIVHAGILLLTTLLFVFNRPVAARFRVPRDRVFEPSWHVLAGLTLAQLAIATYGGFFGARIGIVMLAVFGLMGLDDPLLLPTSSHAAIASRDVGDVTHGRR